MATLLLSRALLPGALAAVALACGPALPGSEAPERPALAGKWFERALASYRAGDLEDARIACDNALRLAAADPEIRKLGARVALAELEWDRTLELARGLEDAEAAGLRGRALWYAGRVEQAADELDALLADPEVRDPWAQEVAKLARRGAGRKPFRMSGGLLAAVEMPRVASTWLIVPLELNGEPALAALATATAETLIDASGGAEAQWVSLRFGERVEVKDVPALPKDLSGISRQLDAPIKLLMGVNLLRHLRPTVDYLGGQFVVRSFDPPPPPAATTVRLSYIRGGGMMLRGGLGATEPAAMAALMVDTSMSFPIALGDSGWKKAGVPTASLRPVPGQAKLKQGMLATLRVGAFEIPQVPALYGVPLDEMAKELAVDLDGVVGSGLIAPFRVTLIDRGRTMWLEDVPFEEGHGAAAPADEEDDAPPPPAASAEPPAAPRGR